jgi:hypothetical protein
MIQDDRSIVSEPDPFSARDGWACDDEEWSGGVEERGLRRKWRQLHVGKAVAARRLFSVSKQGVPSVDWGGPEGGLHKWSMLASVISARVSAVKRLTSQQRP